MAVEYAGSEFHIEKQRINAVITLAHGDSKQGHFFVATRTSHCSGPELVGDLLNGESGFFPFELHDPRANQTVLYNRREVVMVALPENEAARVTGYDVATERFVSVRLSTGGRVAGVVRVYRPRGHDRLSDWARNADIFRYIETGETTVLVNMAHVLEISEVPKP
jgi:hypothetical protein